MQNLVEGIVARCCCKVLLQGVVARCCCQVLLPGVVARFCCQVLLQGVVVQCCCKVLVSIRVCCDVSWHHWDTLTCFLCAFLCDEMEYHFERGVRWRRGFKPEAANT